MMNQKYLPRTVKKYTSLSLAILAFALAGCTASRTWRQVATADLNGKWQAGRSIDYARSLQKMLTADHVPNKLVIYQRYAPGRFPESGLRHGAIIYRDAATPDYPWWFMDNESVSPRWLPNGSIARQVRFSDRSLLRVVEVRVGGATCSPARKHASIAREDWEAQFRKKHGTKFNPLSEADQRKMREIKSWNWTRTAVL